MNGGDSNHVEISTGFGAIVLGQRSVENGGVATEDGVICFGLLKVESRSANCHSPASKGHPGQLTTSNSHLLSNFFFFF